MENKYQDLDKAVTNKIMAELKGEVVNTVCHSCKGKGGKCENCEGKGSYDIKY